MNDIQVRQVFDRLVSDEPDYAPQVGPVLTAGRRALRHRRMALGGSALTVLGGLVVAAVTFAPVNDGRESPPNPRARLNLLTLASKDGVPTMGMQETRPRRRGVFGAMLEAIRASSPSGSRFDLTGNRLDGDWVLDGDVDDGAGPGRLLVVVSTRTDTFLSHPCADLEFKQGAICIEKPLPKGGGVLVLRGVDIVGGNKTVNVVLIRPGTIGILAESGNWAISGVSPGDFPPKTRADLLYSVEKLGRLVRAVDRKVRACIPTACE